MSTKWLTLHLDRMLDKNGKDRKGVWFKKRIFLFFMEGVAYEKTSILKLTIRVDILGFRGSNFYYSMKLLTFL
jgi:hypothetical protein